MTLHSFGLEWLLASKFNNTCQFLYFLYSCNCILENCIFFLLQQGTKNFKKGIYGTKVSLDSHIQFQWFWYMLHTYYSLSKVIFEIFYLIFILFIVKHLQGKTLRTQVPYNNSEKSFWTCCNKIYVIRVFI